MSYVFASAAFVIAYAAKIALVTLGVALLGLVILRWYSGMKLAAIPEKYEDKLHDK